MSANDVSQLGKPPGHEPGAGCVRGRHNQAPLSRPPQDRLQVYPIEYRSHRLRGSVDGAVKQDQQYRQYSPFDHENIAAKTALGRKSFFMKSFAWRKIECRKSLFCKQSLQSEQLQDRPGGEPCKSWIKTVVIIGYDVPPYCTIQITDRLACQK